MRRTMLWAMLVFAAGMPPVQAADGGEVQLSLLLGGQNLKFDDEAPETASSLAFTSRVMGVQSSSAASPRPRVF